MTAFGPSVSEPLDQATLAYIAGVIDVMGRISTRAVGDADLPQVAVSCSNEALLRWLGTLTGVRPFLTTRSYHRHACGTHCPTPHSEVTSVSGRWVVSGVKATVMLRALRPMLRLQAEDADAALLAAHEAHFKPATLRKMLALGWPGGEEPGVDITR
jgi:hypothetical protein